ncbi:MAG: outer membrane beta-barrel protein [Pseudomonadota bacterium]
MTSTKLIALVGGAVAATAFASAQAQARDNQSQFFQRDRYEAVQDRYQEAFDPEPVRLGSLVVNSELALGAEYNDNVFAADSDATVDEETDIIVRIAPTVDVRSDLARHAFGARVQVDHREYTDLDSESATNLRGELRGRLDVTREFDVEGTVFASDEVEGRRDANNQAVFAEPVSFQTTGARAVARYTRDRVRLRAIYQTSQFEYDNVPLIAGGEFDLSERDYDAQFLRARAAYAVSPDVAVFLQGELNQRDYDQTVLIDGNQESRDSEGFAAQVGVNFELPVLIRGDIAVGILEDDVDSDAIADVDGLSLDANVQWFPTRLTTVTFDASRRVTDSGLVGVGSATAQDFGVRVDHELYRNILLFGEAGLGNRDFSSDREDDLFDARLGATYKLNKRFHLDGYVQRFSRDSNFTGNDFDQNLVGIALRIFP